MTTSSRLACLSTLTIAFAMARTELAYSQSSTCEFKGGQTFDEPKMNFDINQFAHDVWILRQTQKLRGAQTAFESGGPVEILNINNMALALASEGQA
jgi:hypothetical protein